MVKQTWEQKASENEQKDAELERSYREIADLKMQLESSETHVVQLRQTRSAESRQSLEEQLASSQKEAEAVRTELSERRDQLMEVVSEVFSVMKEKCCQWNEILNWYDVLI
jgi:septal ring factor EnvC (AmiA/AmiB activator)